MVTCPFNACLIGSLWIWLGCFSGAKDSMPPVRRLIAETLAACNADREGNSLALNDLAAAQCYLGDFDSARKTLLPFALDDIFQQAAHQTCAQIEIELTGSTAGIPQALWNDGFGFMHSDAALAFIERGEIEKALHHVDGIPGSVHSAFNVSGVKLIEKLKERKENDACRKVLLNWASRYEKTDSIFEYRDTYRVPQLVAWLVEFNERPAATSLCERWHAVLQAETDVDESGEFIGRGWAEYVLAISALGDENAARRALDQARHWIEEARAVKFDPREQLACYEFARSYGALAARQAVVLGDDDALAAYGQAYELARLSVNLQYGEYAFERIIDEQLTAGHETGARETIKRIQTPRYIGRSWKRICQHELAHGNSDSARAAARSAVEALDQDGFEPFMAQELAPVAAAAALAGEKELARKLFRRALVLSEANETPKFNHPWIAGIQVHAGLLSDAYLTIQSVEEPSDRIQTLAKLCRALAKAECSAKK
jgi:hypothetical protein